MPRAPEGLLQDGRKTRAGSPSRLVVHSNPAKVDALQLVCKSAFEHQRYPEALKLAETILQGDQVNLTALLIRALSEQLLGRPAAALTSFNQAIVFYPTLAVAYHQRAIVLQDLQRLDEAMADYDRAIKLKPNYHEAFCNRAVLLRNLRRPLDALASVDRAITLRGDYADAHSNRGVVLTDLNRHDDALASYETAIRANPGHAGAFGNRGALLLVMNRFDEALASLDQSLRLDPANAETLRVRANVLRHLGRLDEAIEACRRAIALRPRYREAFHDQGVMLRTLRRYGDALACFDHALTLAPGYADAHVNRGVVLTDLNRHDEALASYDDAIRCDPRHVAAFSNRGSLLCVLKRFDEALESLDRGLDLDPDNAECLNNRGGVLANLGRLDEALATYEKVTRLVPGHAAAHNNKGAMLTELGNLPEALESFETAIALAPRTVRFYFNAAENRTFAAGDHHVTALEAMARNMADIGVDEQINLHFTLAKAYRDIGDKTRVFHHLVQGNALKFDQARYSEPARLETLERLRDAFPAGVMQGTASASEPGPTPVFIVGMPRSGSTLIEQILASHPAVFAAGEVNYFDTVLFDVSPGGDASSPEALAAVTLEAWREAGARHARRLRTMAPDASCVTNKKLMNFMIAGAIHLALPQARIIHARRDPVDTCLSCFSKNFTDDLAFTYDLGALGRYYRGYEKLMDHWRAVLPAGVMLDVQYEDVVTDLEGQARQILRHCGLAWDPRCLDFHKTIRPVRTASRVQVRQPLFASSVGRWKAYEAELAPLLAELDRRS